MNLLLDTHTLLWWLFDDPLLSPRAREAIADRSSRVFVSSASAWEMAIKWRLGGLPEAEDAVVQLPDLLLGAGFEPLMISVAHALAAGRCPRTTRTRSIACSWPRRRSSNLRWYPRTPQSPA